MRTGLQYILSRVVMKSLLGKVAFEQRPVETWGISGRGKDNCKSVAPWRVQGTARRPVAGAGSARRRAEKDEARRVGLARAHRCHRPR